MYCYEITRYTFIFLWFLLHIFILYINDNTIFIPYKRDTMTEIVPIIA